MFQTTNQYFSDWFSVIEPIAIVSFRDRPIQPGNLSCNTSGLRFAAFPKSFSEGKSSTPEVDLTSI
jgi:hypothetical protein